MNSITTTSDTSPLSLQPANTNPVEAAKSDFGNIIQDTIAQTVAAEQQGEQAIEDLASGKAKNLHEVMISVEKADISLKMLVQFRNKAMQAYEEMMRLQI